MKATEPQRSRPAMPLMIWRAVVALALAWGWPRFGAMVALALLALLRPIEWFQATRAALVLPSDINADMLRCWLRIEFTKSRFRGPRRQLGRRDEVWTVALCEAGFTVRLTTGPLWSSSPCTFRRR